MTESEWTNKICKYLEESDIPIVITSFSASVRSQHGIPDRHFCSKVWQGFVEFKGVDTVVTKTQQRFLKMQNLVCSGSAFVWRQVDKRGGLVVSVEDWDGEQVRLADCVNCLRWMGSTCLGVMTRGY